jgi:hypothetical protein
MRLYMLVVKLQEVLLSGVSILILICTTIYQIQFSVTINQIKKVYFVTNFSGHPWLLTGVYKPHLSVLKIIAAIVF